MAFDFDAAVHLPHRMQPGLRRLAPGAQQLTPLRPGPGGPAGHLGEKLAVLGAHAPQALLGATGFDPGPALQALANHAAAEHPQALQIDGGRWHAPWLGWTLDADEQPQAHGDVLPEIGPLLLAIDRPWRRAALLSLAFAEDFAVVDGATGTLPWLAVALPSMWAPEEKVGRSFAEAHAPVADNRLIVGAAPQLVKLVTSSEPWERFVWTLTAHPRLHGHPQRVDPARWAAGLDDDQLAAQTWFRTERQTFIPVPGARQSVFTILVNVTPLTRAFAMPAQAARVHDALASMSDAVLDYRGLTRARPALLRWLARQSQPV
ncbi:heme-dependent oxidative N-demethylase subunit alpha family protein [Pseudaquabacterium pictum]|uniref:DUF3445 domain-containing protein n=1 Tax=Pseudaquabacterium pictum TaxID=2315236 RepID=A0A480APK3_9BURK|nr:heme-dependent oxidative N-demethylase subunit alpha family protein [Rubrivivax pictus]GCL63343.1 hypothetical protein AQPW35_24240 [Rubrivivax pictus]